MMSRRKSRELVMNTLYQMEIHNEFTEAFVEKQLVNHNTKDDGEYIKKMFQTLVDNKTEIDSSIESNLANWKLDRVNKVELSIIRLAVIELLYFDDIPNKVSVNEAIELGKKFSDEESGKFINGVLSKYLA